MNGTFRPKFLGRFKRVENVAAALGARLASHPQQKKILIFPETNIERERTKKKDSIKMEINKNRIKKNNGLIHQN